MQKPVPIKAFRAARNAQPCRFDSSSLATTESLLLYNTAAGNPAADGR
jgi:hypothetical protein